MTGQRPIRAGVRGGWFESRRTPPCPGNAGRARRGSPHPATSTRLIGDDGPLSEFRLPVAWWVVPSLRGPPRRRPGGTRRLITNPTGGPRHPEENRSHGQPLRGFRGRPSTSVIGRGLGSRSYPGSDVGADARTPRTATLMELFAMTSPRETALHHFWDRSQFDPGTKPIAGQNEPDSPRTRSHFTPGTKPIACRNEADRAASSNPIGRVKVGWRQSRKLPTRESLGLSWRENPAMRRLLPSAAPS